MAEEPEDDILELDEALEVETDDDEEQLEQDDQPESDEDDGEEEQVILYGDEAAPASGERDTDLVKHLRAEIRERDKRLAEVARSQPQPQRLELGPKPTLEDCDYDEEAFDRARDEWHEQKLRVQQAQAQQAQMQQASQQAWQQELQRYQDKRAELKFPDVEEVEEVAASALNEVQQAVVVKVADNPALVLYSLGKHPGKLAEISKITDPLKMAAAIAKLEGNLKVVGKKKAAPEPEQIARGSARVSKGSDKTLERLEKEAERTGDRSKIIEYKRQLKQGKS